MNTRTLSLSLVTLLVTTAMRRNSNTTTPPLTPSTSPSLERTLPRLADHFLTEPPITITAY